MQAGTFEFPHEPKKKEENQTMKVMNILVNKITIHEFSGINWHLMRMSECSSGVNEEKW